MRTSCRRSNVRTGRGVATRAVAQLCELAVSEYGLIALRAATTVDNHGSPAVLRRTGFTPVEETELDGLAGIVLVRRLGHAGAGDQ